MTLSNTPSTGNTAKEIDDLTAAVKELNRLKKTQQIYEEIHKVGKEMFQRAAPGGGTDQSDSKSTLVNEERSKELPKRAPKRGAKAAEIPSASSNMQDLLDKQHALLTLAAQQGLALTGGNPAAASAGSASSTFPQDFVFPPVSEIGLPDIVMGDTKEGGAFPSAMFPTFNSTESFSSENIASMQAYLNSLNVAIPPNWAEQLAALSASGLSLPLPVEPSFFTASQAVSLPPISVTTTTTASVGIQANNSLTLPSGSPNKMDVNSQTDSNHDSALTL